MKLDFLGRIRNGAGLFSKEIHIPSPLNAPPCFSGWPTQLAAGTLNIQIEHHGWPAHRQLEFKTLGAQALDRSDHFPPGLYLDHSCVPGNTLNPSNRGAFGGDLQFWKSELVLSKTRKPVKCYLLRRVGSGYLDTLEIVADVHLRHAYSLYTGQLVRLVVYWGNS